MSENEKQEKPKTGLPPFIKIGIVIFAVIIVLGIIVNTVSQVLIKKVSQSVVQQTLENKTGIKADIKNVENGEMTFTDKKTGAKVEINTGKIPDSFPKDFPIYPNTKIASTFSGKNNEKESGSWITFTTNDQPNKIIEFYDKNLISAGWTIVNEFTMGNTKTYTVKKGNLEGNLSINTEEGKSETNIVVILGTGDQP